MRIADAGAEVAISVTDKGAGMDAEFVRNALFQPFVSSKPAGFGIGAFEARSLIGAMGGRITVDSTPGVGTHFAVYVPAAAAGRAEERKIA